MSTVLARKLEYLCPLTAEERRVLDNLTSKSRPIAARKSLIREAERIQTVQVILSGFASRSRLLPSGARQIFGYVLPGDIMGLNVYLRPEMDHDIFTLTDCIVADVQPQVILDITKKHLGIGRSFWWSSLVLEAVLREWIVNLAIRRADRRLAHLLCELLTRLKTVGLAPQSTFKLPLTQQDLGDTLGMTSIHVNRSLRELRETRLVTVKNRTVVIHDIKRLKNFAGFDERYLHLRSAD